MITSREAKRVLVSSVSMKFIILFRSLTGTG